MSWSHVVKKDSEFDIFHGDTLLNEWDMMREPNPAKKPSFDAIVANPPFSYRWEPTDALADDVLLINASGPENFDKGKRQNQLSKQHIAKIIDTYQFRKEETRYSRRVEMDGIKKNDFNLNISRYISTAVGEAEIDLAMTHDQLGEIEKAIQMATSKHNGFLKELGLPLLPASAAIRIG